MFSIAYKCAIVRAMPWPESPKNGLTIVPETLRDARQYYGIAWDEVLRGRPRVDLLSLRWDVDAGTLVSVDLPVDLPMGKLQEIYSADIPRKQLAAFISLRSGRPNYDLLVGKVSQGDDPDYAANGSDGAAAYWVVPTRVAGVYIGVESITDAGNQIEQRYFIARPQME